MIITDEIYLDYGVYHANPDDKSLYSVALHISKKAIPKSWDRFGMAQKHIRLFVNCVESIYWDDIEFFSYLINHEMIHDILDELEDTELTETQDHFVCAAGLDCCGDWSYADLPPVGANKNALEYWNNVR